MEINFELDLLAVCNDGYINSGMVKEFLEVNPSLKKTVINGDSEDAGQVIASVLKTLLSHQVGELAKKYAEEQFDNWLNEVGLVMEDREEGLDKMKLEIKQIKG